MRYRGSSIAACAVIACMVAAGGCGGGATDQFRSRYNRAGVPLHQTFVDLANTFTHASGKTTAEIARSLGALATRFGRELAPLEALKPPATVAPAFRMLTTSLNRVEGDLRKTYVAVTHRDLAAAQQALASLQSDARAATDSAAAVTRKLNHK